MTFGLQDSVVFLEDGLSDPAPATQESGDSQKKLRSLNDVLGKNITASKASKNTPGSAYSQVYILAFSLSK